VSEFLTEIRELALVFAILLLVSGASISIAAFIVLRFSVF
jgi:hypothetical protein